MRRLAALLLLALPAAAEEPGFSLYDAVVEGSGASPAALLIRVDPPQASPSTAPSPQEPDRTYRFIQDPGELDAFGPQNSYTPGPGTGAAKGTTSLDDLPTVSGRSREGLGKLFEDPQNLEAKRRDGTVQYYDLDGDGRLDAYESDASTQIGPLELRVKGRGDSAGFSPLDTILPIRPQD